MAGIDVVILNIAVTFNVELNLFGLTITIFTCKILQEFIKKGRKMKMKKKKTFDAETAIILCECNRLLMAVGENPLDDIRCERRKRRQRRQVKENFACQYWREKQRIVFREQVARQRNCYTEKPFGEKYEKYVTVIAIVRFVPDNSRQRSLAPRILLVKNRGWNGASFPGGHIEPGETLEQAVVREVAEETGLDIEGMVKKLGRRKVGSGTYMMVFMANLPWSRQAEILPTGGPEQEWCGTKTAAEIDKMAADGRLMHRNHKPIWEFYRQKFADEL